MADYGTTTVVAQTAVPATYDVEYLALTKLQIPLWLAWMLSWIYNNDSSVHYVTYDCETRQEVHFFFVECLLISHIKYRLSIKIYSSRGTFERNLHSKTETLWQLFSFCRCPDGKPFWKWNNGRKRESKFRSLPWTVKILSYLLLNNNPHKY